MQDLPGRKGGPVLGAIVGIALLAGTAGAQGRVWSYPSDGSWIAEAVSLGGNGGQAFTEVGAFQHSRRLFAAQDQDPPAPVWVDEASEMNFVRRVASSAEADVHAAMVQVYADAQHTTRKAVLRKHSTAGGAPDWVYEFPTVIVNHPYSDVGVSADGERVVGVVYDSGTLGTRVTAFGSDSAVPVADFDAATFGGFLGWDLSSDGSVVAFESQLKVSAFDVLSGAPLLESYLFGSLAYGALSLSADGSRLARGTNGEVRVFERVGGGGFQLMTTIGLPSGWYARSVDLSGDGGRLAIGMNLGGNPNAARLRVVDVDTQIVLTDHVIQGSGELSNVAEHVALSKAGAVAVLGLWGDEAGTVPELEVFEVGRDEPTATFDLAGSVLDLDLSPDGSRVAVAAKGGHAGAWGGGGEIALFATRQRDFDLEGVPRAGATVVFRQPVRPGGWARVLCSPTLAATPTVFAGVGTLVLERPTMWFLPGFAQGDASGVARTSLALPADPSLVGTSAYYQGLGLSPRDLTEDWVRLVVLP